MPAGKSIAGAFDSQGDAIAISRPIDVKEGKTIGVTLSTPIKGTDVFVVLERPRRVTVESSDQVTLKLEVTGEREAKVPDVMINASDAVYAIWYGIASDSAILQVASDTVSHPAVPLKLRSGKVSTVRSRLLLRPSLDISTIAPSSSLNEREWTLTIAAAGRIVRILQTTPNSTIRAEALPPEPLDITLDITPWRFSKAIDLSSGQDGRIEFVLEPVIVTGRVTRDGEPTRAEIRFSTRRDEYELATTQENGEYETILWRSGEYPVFVQPLDRASAPFVDFVSVFDGSRLDFDLPVSLATVHVQDSRSGKPVAAAAVAFANTWDDPKVGRRRTGQRTATDTEGVAVSPPLRKGELQVAVTAEGYRSPEAITRPVGSEDQFDLRIDLEPFTEGATLLVVLSSGAPAVGAQIVSYLPGDDYRPYWQGTTNQHGEARIPEDVENRLLLIRHADGAGVTRVWDPLSPASVTLPSPGKPLTVRVALATGGAAPHAEVMLLIGSQRISGPALGFFAWSMFRTDGAGMWTGQRLACHPVRMIAYTRPALRTPILAGYYDSLATTIDCPWPPVVTLKSIE